MTRGEVKRSFYSVGPCMYAILGTIERQRFFCRRRFVCNNVCRAKDVNSRIALSLPPTKMLSIRTI